MYGKPLVKFLRVLFYWVWILLNFNDNDWRMSRYLAPSMNVKMGVTLKKIV